MLPVSLRGERGGYVHAMYLNDHAPIVGGRELWGFPKKLGQPELGVHKDTFIGTLDYGGIRIATGTMGYKHQSVDTAEAQALLMAPAFVLKIIPHVDGTPRICELVRYTLAEVAVKGAWRGPGGLQLYHHALAPLAELPVREVTAAVHLLTDLTLPFGQVVHDYLA